MLLYLVHLLPRYFFLILTCEATPTSVSQLLRSLMVVRFAYPTTLPLLCLGSVFPSVLPCRILLLLISSLCAFHVGVCLVNHWLSVLQCLHYFFFFFPFLSLNWCRQAPMLLCSLIACIVPVSLSTGSITLYGSDLSSLFHFFIGACCSAPFLGYTAMVAITYMAIYVTASLRVVGLVVLVLYPMSLLYYALVCR